MSKQQQFHINAHLILLMLIAFFLPIAKLTPVFIVLLLLNWIIEGDFSAKFRVLFSKKIALVFIAFYLLHVIGLTYTLNMPSGMFDLEVKLSILVFPLILSNRPVDGSGLNKIMYALTLGCVVSLFIMLGRATYIFFDSGENNFFYQALSFLIHPSYISMYMNLCIAWLIYHFLNGSLKTTRFSKLTTVCIVIFFSFMMILLSSKMGFLTLMFLYVGFLIYFVLKKKNT